MFTAFLRLTRVDLSGFSFTKIKSTSSEEISLQGSQEIDEVKRRINKIKPFITDLINRLNKMPIEFSQFIATIDWHLIWKSNNE